MGKRKKKVQKKSTQKLDSGSGGEIKSDTATTSTNVPPGPWVKLIRLSPEEVKDATSIRSSMDEITSDKDADMSDASSNDDVSHSVRKYRKVAKKVVYNEQTDVVCLSEDSDNDDDVEEKKEKKKVKTNKEAPVTSSSSATSTRRSRPCNLTEEEIIRMLYDPSDDDEVIKEEEEEEEDEKSDKSSNCSRSYEDDNGDRRSLRQRTRIKYTEYSTYGDEKALKLNRHLSNGDADYNMEYSDTDDDADEVEAVDSGSDDHEDDEDYKTSQPRKKQHYDSSDRSLRQRGDIISTYTELDESDPGLSGDDDENIVVVDKKTGAVKTSSHFIVAKTKKKHTHLKILMSPSAKQFCKLCGAGENRRLYCDSCAWIYHTICLDPPLTKLPKDDKELKTVHCPRCTIKPINNHLDTKLTQILSWRWTCSTKDEVDENLPLLQQQYLRDSRREFFVHISGSSFWDCKWVSELQLRFYYSTSRSAYLKKTDMTTPPEFTDEELEEEFDLNDPLYKKYYQFGVKPQWLQISRIINERRDANENMDYLVKWKDLDYTFTSWEPEKKMRKLIPAFKKALKIFQEHKILRSTSTSLKNGHKFQYLIPPPGTAVINLEEKYTQQPDFVDPHNEGLILHPYQLEGLNWLRYSYSQRTPTILADEMGLGKTIQTILFLYSLYKEGHCKGPFLISAPLSTVINWEREFEKWAPDLYIVTYTGQSKNRMAIRENDLSYDNRTRKGPLVSKLKGPVKFNVLLTSFEFISIDSALLSPIRWQVIIIDEGHRLRDFQAKFFQYLINYTARYKICLTGTPLQNNLEELFHLLSYLSPKKFCDLGAFQDEFTDISQEEQVKKLHELLAPHMLRRLKVDVLKDLPTKSELIVGIELTPMQKKFYKFVLTKNFGALNSKLGGRKTSLQNILMDLRKCCNHPYLFSTAEMDAPKDEEGELYEMSNLVKASGKLLLLQKMLKSLKTQGHRVLIFSQMTRMLDILEDFMEQENYKYERIDGKVSGNLRQEAIDRFNSPESEQFVFLLSTRAGGLGINLATADTVIVYDSDWNPHNDIQAFSRAHRIGQKNKVMIYRFVTRNSVEERITQVAKKKMMLTHLVVRPGMGGGENKMSYSKQELEDIVQFGAEELFEDDDKKETTCSTSSPIVDGVYTDEAIQNLMDRNRDDGGEKETFFNEYLSKFKVVNYIAGTSKEEEDDWEQEDELNGALDQDMNRPQPKVIKPVYWQKWLGAAQQREEDRQKTKLKSMDLEKSPPKGRRLRKRINVIDLTGRK